MIALQRVVLDASVVVELLSNSRSGRLIADEFIKDDVSLHAPELLDVEVLQVLRKLEKQRVLSAAHAMGAATMLAELPITRHSHDQLCKRVWSLRGNCTAYDAVYVALSEALDATFVTRDARLARALTSTVAVRVV